MIQTEITFFEMIQKLFEKEYNLNQANALFNLDFLIHESNVDGIRGPVALQIEYFNLEHTMYSHVLDSIISQRINYVKRELKTKEIIKNAIIVTNLNNDVIEEYTSINVVSKEIAVWGRNEIEALLKKHSDIIIDSPDEIFLDSLNEEISELITHPEKREEQIRYNNNKYIEMLKNSLLYKQLSLFLGAGVSMSANLPAWSKLVQQLYFKALNENGVQMFDIDKQSDAYWKLTSHLGEMNLLIRTRYAKSLIKSNFLATVREHLYKNSKGTSQLLKEIAKLCVSNTKELSGVKSVITYNFDDLLEQHIEISNGEYTSIWKEEQSHVQGCLPIYHVHGFLPQSYTINDSIIFSEDDYHRVYKDMYSWSNLIQLNRLRDSNGLFIGLSLSDPNIRRLLDASRTNSKRNHFIIMRRVYTEGNVRYTSDMSNEVMEIIKPLETDHFLRKQYPQVFLSQETVQEAMLTEELLIEKDLNSLGLNVIWVNDFEEISTCLSNIIIK
ncbi:SIR2 family protein [Bacillus cereus]|uniref:SIR2 family protein n=1 Tax=Bacillus cereus TaxID=1396 RepID=UPI00227EA491|nr:SIR2 family protein [Bacillus cereus]